MKLAWLRKLAREPHGLEVLARGRVGDESIGAIAAALRAAGFSPAAYRANDDLRDVLANDKQAIWHFLAYCGGFTHVYPLTPEPEGFARLCALRMPPRCKADVLANLLSCFSRPGGDLWNLPVEDRRSLLRDLCESMEPVASVHVVAGDSHSNLYRHLVAARPCLGRLSIPIHVLCTGASARGLSRPASRSGSGARLLDLARSLPTEGIELFFKFGQVDVEFNFNFDRIRAGRAAFDEAEFVRFCEQSADTYTGFLSEHFAGRAVNVMSVFPPALSDAAWREGYTNAQIVSVETEQSLEDIVRGLHDLEIPSLVERSRHHANFNEMIASRAAQTGFGFFDDFTPMLGPGGILDPRYISTHGGSDHHLEHSPAADVLSALLGSHLASKERLDVEPHAEAPVAEASRYAVSPPIRLGMSSGRKP